MLNPIMTSSAVRRMRSVRLPLVLIGYAAFMLGVCLVQYLPFMQGVRVTMLNRGVNTYGMLLMLQCVLLVLIAPALTSASIAGERERQTLEMLLVTRTGSFRIAMGKLLESMMSLGLVVLCGLPAMAVTMVIGGLSLTQILLAEIYFLALAFAAGAIGVFASALCRTTMIATILSYLLILLIGFSLCLPALLGYSQNVTDVLYDAKLYAALTVPACLRLFSPLFHFNPGVGAFALIMDQTNMLADYFSWRPWGRVLATYKMMDKIGMQRIVLLNVAGLVVMGLLFSLLASFFVRRREGKRKGRK